MNELEKKFLGLRACIFLPLELFNVVTSGTDAVNVRCKSLWVVFEARMAEFQRLSGRVVSDEIPCNCKSIISVCWSWVTLRRGTRIVSNWLTLFACA